MSIFLTLNTKNRSRQSPWSLPMPELYQLQFILTSSLNNELSLMVTEFYPFLQVPHRFLPLKNHSFRRQQRPGVELPSPSVCYEPDLTGTKPQSFTCLYLSLRLNAEIYTDILIPLPAAHGCAVPEKN